MSQSECNISPLSNVHPQAKLGVGVSVGAFATIGQYAEIGDYCQIDDYASVIGHTRLQKKNRIYAHAVVGGEPQDLKYQGEISYLEIGKENKIRECVTINTGTEGGGLYTRIGNNNLIMAYCHIAHDCQIANNTVLVNGTTFAGHVEVEDGAVISAFSCIHQFTRIGQLSMSGGASMISQDVPPFTMVTGNHATLRGLNTLGLKRAGFSNEQIDDIKTVYRILFKKGLTVEESATEILSLNISTASALELLSFVQSSKRGVCRQA